MTRAACWLACLALACWHAPAQARTMLSGVCPPDAWSAGWEDAGPWPADAVVTPVRIVLGLRNPTGLQALVAAQHDPASPEFRRWRTPQELADRFGPRRARYARVRAWLAAAGLQIVEDSPLRSGITVAGTTAQLERAFHSELRALRRGGRTVHAPRVEPTLPADIAASVATILGLDDMPTIRPTVQLTDGTFGLAPADLALAYELTPLLAAGANGAGATIAVIARSDYAAKDVATFRNLFLPGATGTVRKRFPSGNPGVLPSSGNVEENEVLLDTQWSGAAAPGADIDVMIGGQRGGVIEALRVAIETNRADVISFSFALCEADAPTSYARVIDTMYTLANAQGQTVVVAAGDNGITECQQSTARAVNLLASSPHAIAVGGTALALSVDGSGNATGLVDERVWNDAGGAGGGGVSGLFAAPRFQRAAGIVAGGRALPDLALAASPITPGYALLRRGNLQAIGGTSASAPALSGMLALAVARGGSRLGQLVPTIHRLGAAQAAGTGPTVFRDITLGSNGYAATPGFDQASGWGAPLGTAFIDAIAGVPGARVNAELDALIPGNAPASASCGVQWLLDFDLPTRRPGRPGYLVGTPRPRQSCRDGDPTCDRDGTVNGVCTLRLGLCLNVNDPRATPNRRTPICRPRTISALSVRTNGTSNAPFAALISAFDLPTTQIDACSDFATVELPLTAGTTRFIARAERTTGPSTARVALRCTP